MMHGLEGHGWGMGWAWIIGLVILVAIIWLVVKAVNQDSNASQSKNRSTLNILKERYARSEISKKEYEEKRNDIL
jgi:putative membrane protein